MSGIYNKEEKDRTLYNIIADHKTAAGFFPIIRNITQLFDGKVLNCRYQKALREAGAQVTVEKRYKWLEISFYAGGRTYTLAQIDLDNMPDQKRIPADLIIDSAREKRQRFLQEAAQIQHDIDNAETYKMQLDYFLDQIEKIRKNISYEARDAYKLDYRLRY